MLKVDSKTIRTALLASMALILGACGHYPSINVTVVDAETSEPIEGAVLMSQWTITKGPMFLTTTGNYKVVEETSDKTGMITIPGVSNSHLDHPRVTVYKKGYVAWNNERIFPDYKKRKSFQWRDGYEFRLERFKPEYSHRKHVSFITTRYTSGVPSFGLFRAAWAWERLLSHEDMPVY